MFRQPGPIEFSKWVLWNRRKDDLVVPDEPWLGVYLWAHFHEAPSPKVRPYPNLPQELIYVGETKHLDVRPLGSGHHRLSHYRDTFPADPDLRYLYVSVYPVEPYRPEDARCHALRAFTQYIEDKIYWEYVCLYGKRAALNYKKKPDWNVVAACCAVKPPKR